jgi:endoglucanase
MNIRSLQRIAGQFVIVCFCAAAGAQTTTTYSAWSNSIAWGGYDPSPGADPNNDRIKNLIAYAMDLSPTSAPPAAMLPSLEPVAADATNSAGFVLTYRMNANASDIDFHITTATNLSSGSWVSLDAAGLDSSVGVVNTNVDGDGSAQLMQTRIHPSGDDSSRFLRFEASLYETGGSNRLESWPSLPWELTAGQTAFTGTFSSVLGPVEFVFSDPLKGVNVTDPDHPDFSTASDSFFGVESTGFGVNEATVGRFDRGESFTIQADRSFQLKAIRWAEYTGDEAIHMSWFCNGMPRSSTIAFGPGSFYTETPFFGVYPDSNTPLRISNVSDSTANASGRLRVNYIDTAFVPPSGDTQGPIILPDPIDPALCGAAMILSDWALWPWNATNGTTVLSGTMTAPENGGTPATFTFTALDDIDVTYAPEPDFASATPDYFGVEATGFGVGDPTTGRFDRGEAIKMTCSHDYILDVIRWREVDGDERLHINWTSGGTQYGGVFDITNAISQLTNMTVDAGTEIVIVNVSPATSPLDGRLRIQDIKARAVYETAPAYNPSGADGFEQMTGVNLAGAEFGGYAFWQTDTNQWNYYHSKGLDLIRIPFKWERIQTNLYEAVDFSDLDQVVALAHERGMKVILDMHNYARYTSATLGTNILIGTTNVPYEAYADVWRQIADHYQDEPAIYGYGIMNEPHDTGGLWPTAAQAAADAIREVDTNHWMIVGGENWSSAYSWRTSNADLNVTDPYGKVMYEAHIYFDTKYPAGDGGYNSYDVEKPADDKGVYGVNPFILWLQERNARGFIGEYGTPKTDARWNRVLEPFMSHITAYGLSGTYWAGGKNWNNYQLDCSPTDNYTVDALQMEVLEQYTP